MNPFRFAPAARSTRRRTPLAPRTTLNVERLEDRTLLSVSLQYSSLSAPLLAYQNSAVSFTQSVTVPDRNGASDLFTANLDPSSVPSGVTVSTSPGVLTFGASGFPDTESWVVTFAVAAGASLGTYSNIKIKARPSTANVAGGSGTSVTLIVAANTPPTLTNPGPKTFDELTPLAFTLSATDPDVPPQTLTYSIAAGQQTGMTVNATTGAFNWTPSETQDGVYNVTLRVTDSVGAFDQKTIAITVREVNVAPVLNAIPTPAPVVKTLTRTFAASATDSDIVAGVPNTLTFSLQGDAHGATINPTTGAFSWTPTQDDGPGNFNFTVRVTDNGNPTLFAERVVTITTKAAGLDDNGNLLVVGTSGPNTFAIDVVAGQTVAVVDGVEAFRAALAAGKIVNVKGFLPDNTTGPGDALTGPNLPNVWTIDGTHQGSINGQIFFTGIEYLRGGTAHDAANITATGVVSLLNGFEDVQAEASDTGAPLTVDASQSTGALTFKIKSGNVNIKSGQGDDLFIAPLPVEANNTLAAQHVTIDTGGGKDIVLGTPGATVNARGGDDTYIGLAKKATILSALDLLDANTEGGLPNGMKQRIFAAFDDAAAAGFDDALLAAYDDALEAGFEADLLAGFQSTVTLEGSGNIALAGLFTTVNVPGAGNTVLSIVDDAAKNFVTSGVTAFADDLAAGFDDVIAAGFDDVLAAGYAQQLTGARFEDVLGAGFDDVLANGFAPGLPLHPRFEDILASGFDDAVLAGFEDALASGFEDELAAGFDDVMQAAFDDVIAAGFDDAAAAGFEDALAAAFENELQAGFDNALQAAFDNALAQGFSGNATQLRANFEDMIAAGFADELAAGFGDELAAGFRAATGNVNSGFATGLLGALRANINADGGNNVVHGGPLTHVTIDGDNNFYIGGLSDSTKNLASSLFGTYAPDLAQGTAGWLFDSLEGDVVFTGQNNAATVGLLTTVTMGDGSDLLVQHVGAADVALLQNALSFAGTNQAAKDQIINAFSLSADLGAGNNTAVGGVLAKFTAGAGADRFFIEDPALLGVTTDLSAYAFPGGTFAGGGGGDTYSFVGAANFGVASLTEAAGASGVDTLDFSSYTGGPVNLDLAQTTTQNISAGKLSLTLSDPQGFENVIGTASGDTIKGNDQNNVILGAQLKTDDRIPDGLQFNWNGQTQNVYLDFSSVSQTPYSLTGPGQYVYSAQDKAAIKAALQTDYQAFSSYFKFYIVGTDVLPVSGGGGVPGVTVFFNNSPTDSGAPRPGGFSDDVDLRNVNKTGVVQVDINGFLGGDGQPALTSGNAVTMSATLAAHEVGHNVGLVHSDALGALGLGTHLPPGAAKYLPNYGGIVQAFETTNHIMASPASVGSTLFDTLAPPFFGERELIKLAIDTQWTNSNVTQEVAGSGATQTFTIDPVGRPQDAVAAVTPVVVTKTAQSVALAPLYVPNTMVSGVNAGKTFDVAAAVVAGQIGLAGAKAESDFYAFTGRAGDLINLEALSLGMNRLGTNTMDPVLRVYGPDGKLMLLGSGVAVNDDDFDGGIANIVDLTLPAYAGYTGDYTFYVEVDTFTFQNNPAFTTIPSSATDDARNDTDTGAYEVLVYRFSAHNATSGDDTLTGGAGVNKLNGGDGVDTAKETGDTNFVLTNTGVTTGQGTNTLISIEKAGLTGGATANSFDVSAWTGGAVTLDGQGAVDTTIYAANTVNAWHITGANAGDINGVINFLNMENLTGGAQADTFFFSNGKGVSGAVNGGGGYDTLNYSAYTSAVTVNRQTGAATGAGSFASIEQVVGGAASDTLIGADTASAWNITANNAGSINGAFDFSSFENLTGGAQADSFVLANGKTISGQVNGGGGVDTLDYSAWTTAVQVNLAAGTATATGGVTLLTLENVIGGSAGDTLTGDANANVFTGGRGSDTMDGAGGDDVFVIGDNTAAETDTITGGDGRDGVDFRSRLNSAITLDLNIINTTQVVSANYNLVLKDAIENVFGTRLSDTITGNTLDNFLVGDPFDPAHPELGGDDILIGGDGNDVLIGHGGADELTGSNGNDVLVGGLGADRLVGSAGADILFADELSGVFDYSSLLDVPALASYAGQTWQDNYALLRTVGDAWAQLRPISDIAGDTGDSTDITTITTDGQDSLTGNTGGDWFVLQTTDRITDASTKDGDKITYLS